MMTPRKARFVEEYLIDLNATNAAKRAGYSEKTANTQGSRLLADVDIATAITEARAARTQRNEITADQVLKELGLVAFGATEQAPRVADKVKALELIGRHLAMWKDRVEVEAPEPFKIELTDYAAPPPHPKPAVPE